MDRSVQAEASKRINLFLGRYTNIIQVEIADVLVVPQSLIREGRNEKVFKCTDSRAVLRVFTEYDGKIKTHHEIPQHTEKPC